MKRLIALFVALMILFTTTTARSQDLPSPVISEVPEAVLTPLDKDDKAPYAGVLLSPDAIANIIAEYKAFGDRLRIELERAQGEADAQKRLELESLSATCDADKKILQTEVDAGKRENKILVERQKKLEKSNKNVLTWTMAGVGVGAILSALGFYGISRLTD